MPEELKGALEGIKDIVISLEDTIQLLNVEEGDVSYFEEEISEAVVDIKEMKRLLFKLTGEEQEFLDMLEVCNEGSFE